MMHDDPETFDDETAHKDRLTDVMSRVGVNLRSVYDPKNGKAWIEAAHTCKVCKSVEDCAGWVAFNDEGAGSDAPEFCPNAELLKRFKANET